MAHNLNIRKNGKAAMAYVAGEGKPWHELGTAVPEAMDSKTAIIEGGLDYEVALKPYMVDGKASALVRAIVRMDTGDELGAVGGLYTPLQNSEAFNFLDAVAPEFDLRYHTVGALGRGERIWLLTKLPGEIRIGQTEDVTEKFLLLTNSHDGKSKLRIFFTPIRVVCQNTLNIAMAGGIGQGIAIAHFPDIHKKVAQARKALGLATKYYDSFADLANKLSLRKAQKVEVKKYLEILFPSKENAKIDKAKTIREDILGLYEDAPTNNLKGTSQTWWSAYNAVAEYADHKRLTLGKSEQEKREHRLNSLLFGSSAELKQEAWDKALECAGVELASA